MNKIIMLSLILAAFFGFQGKSLANEAQPKVKLNPSQLAKAAELIKKNPALFKDPKVMERFLALSRAMQNKQ
ncbi:MAG: hypothetical protein KC713_10420 [Candidatus Omnitrophica bacterium]|nr:hypothetical protein [Candidatus Omnitrophota bacterium]